MRFVIKGKLDGLNEYTRANRSNRYEGAMLKKQNEDIVYWSIVQAKLIRIVNYPITLKITWYEPNLKRDIDNIVFATKFIQDALVRAKILKNDGQKQINRITHDVFVDKDNPRVEVELI